MATMHVRRYRFAWRAIGIWLGGVLCGVLLMVGIVGLHQPAHAPAAAAVTTAPLTAQGRTSAGKSGASAAAPGASAQPAADSSANDLPRLDETTYYRYLRLSAPPLFERARALDPQ